MKHPIKWKIVLIDDEKDIREVMSLVLEDAGYYVITAHDGATGIRLCKETAPQIVITDIRMPGISGIQVLEAVKKHFPDVEVIVITAFGDMDLAIQALKLDASDFITKPVNEHLLSLSLKRAQKRYTSRRQLKNHTRFLEKEKAKNTQELIKTYAFQKNLIESSMDGILGCDERETTVIFNQSMEQMLGYTKKDVLDKKGFSLFFVSGEWERLKKELEQESHGGKNRLYLYETSLLKKSGDIIPVQTSAIMLFEQNRQSGVVCFFRDLCELRKLEWEVANQATILHQDKMMSLGRLAASVVHEINNPLTGILNYTKFMIRVLNRGPITKASQNQFQQKLELMESETSRCSQIISSLLTFARKSNPSFEQIKVADLLQRAIILSRHKAKLHNIGIIPDVKPDIPFFKGDFNQLQQCIINLIFNSIDAMPKGGTIMLLGNYDKKENKVVITVADSGTGISSKDLPHIFEPFFTTKEEGYGVGLGLSTVYGIIKHHQGSVSVKNSSDRGTAFILEFPVL